MDEKTCSEIRRRESESKVTVQYDRVNAGDWYLHPHFCLPFDATFLDVVPLLRKTSAILSFIIAGKKHQQWRLEVKEFADVLKYVGR